MYFIGSRAQVFSQIIRTSQKFKVQTNNDVNGSNSGMMCNRLSNRILNNFLMISIEVLEFKDFDFDKAADV